MTSKTWTVSDLAMAGAAVAILTSVLVSVGSPSKQTLDFNNSKFKAGPPKVESFEGKKRSGIELEDYPIWRSMKRDAREDDLIVDSLRDPHWIRTECYWWGNAYRVCDRYAFSI